ncbi:MAG: hypothetical protein L0027_06570 [Candidatus Rokubacteria bacterium]|nr:hypothetical protein [Candidatus Rokubacteria bacterium]
MPHGEPCRYPPKPGTEWCSTHLPYPGRRVDVTGFCAAWRPMLAARCQSYRLPGSLFCVEHDRKRSTCLPPAEGEEARRRAPTSGNGHRPAPTPPGSSGATRARLPTAERQARSIVIAAMGNNPAAILVTIGLVVETGAGPLSWSLLRTAAEREGLLPPAPSPRLAGMLLGALRPR